MVVVAGPWDIHTKGWVKKFLDVQNSGDREERP
jgi:hypothetical protein